MNTKKKKWNVDDTCKLIELYRESPILWDATNLNYKNKFKKADALKEIGMQLSTDANEIDRKLKNVCSQYSMERCVSNLEWEEISMQSGSGMI